MRLAEYTDLTLRVLMYCAARPQQLVTISELAERHAVSRNHLMKIVTDLGRQGVLETTRGRGGGLRLLKDPARIRVGDVVRASETDFRLVECFDPATDQCTLTSSCRLKGLFSAALGAFFKELDSMTLADIVEHGSSLASGPAMSLRGRAEGAPVAPPKSLRTSARAGKSDA
ncbi:Rrf2 family transcriptional regulator [Quisquiliibacterium transsilvanicum]|uniref:Rrf2 family nitric oxide-sensitive transcriptional repressor n=1 Tax=Quisquiliibacterium transsilvanicum TaxID=1549638 RepID=A0A7W8M803_9BURK|nr:Rrf2 family transcriptional regulator [Quisquiliibacterium transsilvanicum]MBB5270479.1 Rrf2 family nitric oxide-sensitive transcriptional repressor [Quisquiliibacterium transsilvanicum]